MSAVLRRVRKLVALSGSPNENEGRSAAFLACRLIREHGLEVMEPVVGRRRVEREREDERPAEPRRRRTRGPYTRARHLRSGSTCRECSEPIANDDACLDADDLPVHGDCIPRGERP